MFKFTGTKKHLTYLGLAACAGLAVAATSASAQSYDDDAGAVTVYAPHHMQPDRDGATGARIETIDASQVVPLDDLNLSTGWGRHLMVQRISSAAYQLCDQLDQTNLTTPDITTSQCVSRATRDAVYRVDQAQSGDE